MSVTLRIAMWSGPRNLSTAMMRSFGNRADYVRSATSLSTAPSSRTSGADHPMREEVIAAMDCDWASVARDARRAGAGRPADLVPEAYVAPHGRAGRL